jgi:biotin carboxylase
VPLPSAKVLVVGTTTDYVDWIRRSHPGRALFLTDPALRRTAWEPAPAENEEILADLSDAVAVQAMLSRHLRRYDITLDGVACFDCESMALAAELAAAWKLPYPCREAVQNCRNKLRSRELWLDHALDIPAFRCITSPAQAARFFSDIQGPCVFKPLSGSGSELIFCAHSAAQAETYFSQIHHGLTQRQGDRLYDLRHGQQTVVLGEACIEGDEYSCDFILAGNTVQIIRLARKIPAPDGPFGTIMGYLLTRDLPPGVDEPSLRQVLLKSALALGLERAFCMIDFMVHQGRIILIELAPRPGGDCLPALLRTASGLDILSIYLDFCQQRSFSLPPAFEAVPYIGLRLHAQRSGQLKRIDTQRLQRDERVRDLAMVRRPGDQITMPPADYTSWLLGHVIFVPDRSMAPEFQCRLLMDQLEVEIC